MPKIISDDAVFKLQKNYYLYAIDKNGDMVHIYQKANGKQCETPLTPFFLNYVNGIALEKVLDSLKRDDKKDDKKGDKKSDEESDDEIECNHDFKNPKKQHISNATENNSKEVKYDKSCIHRIIFEYSADS